jgi:hypothetical protein
MTPLAAKWTAFEKHRRPYARPVVNGKFLDIEYNAFCLGDRPPFAAL